MTELIGPPRSPPRRDHDCSEDREEERIADQRVPRARLSTDEDAAETVAGAGERVDRETNQNNLDARRQGRVRVAPDGVHGGSETGVLQTQPECNESNRRTIGIGSLFGVASPR